MNTLLESNKQWKNVAGATRSMIYKNTSANTDIRMKIGYRNHPISQITQIYRLAGLEQIYLLEAKLKRLRL